jgi:hypothetical protein
LAKGAHTGHQFAVTESGAATITVPVQIPPGIAGVEPQLALNYSSGAGNGLFGLGWSLSGPSAITRCPKVPHHDGVRGAVTFGASDRFCLDGQRLLTIDPANNTDSLYAADGREYRTERDSFARVKVVGIHATGAPASFRVETKAGLVLEFGLSDDSRVMTKYVDSGFGPNAINRWMLQRISDRMPQPNYVEFGYCGGEVSVDGKTCNAAAWAGSKVLHWIRYTNRGGLNGNAGVVFGYEARPDRIQQFHHGSSSVQTQRVAVISTYVNFAGPATPGARVKRYQFSYDTMKDAAGAWARATNSSRLLRIQEFDGTAPDAATGDPTNALPAIEMTYAPDAVFGKYLHQAASGTTAAFRSPDCGGVTGTRYTLMCP